MPGKFCVNPLQFHQKCGIVRTRQATNRLPYTDFHKITALKILENCNVSYKAQLVKFVTM